MNNVFLALHVGMVFISCKLEADILQNCLVKGSSKTLFELNSGHKFSGILGWLLVATASQHPSRVTYVPNHCSLTYLNIHLSPLFPVLPRIFPHAKYQKADAALMKPRFVRAIRTLNQYINAIRTR